MDRIKTILLGIDFSASSRAALDQAVRIANDTGARLHVIHVIESLVIEDLAEVFRKDKDQVRQETIANANRALDKMVHQLDIPEATELHVAIGPPTHEILTAVKQIEPDLLILGERGMSSPSHHAGSLAVKCIRKAPTKVLLVNEEASGSFGRVVACVDFSDCSRQAVIQGIRLARCNRCPLHLVHVFHGPWHHLQYRGESMGTSAGFEKQYRENLEDKLKEEFARVTAHEPAEDLEVHYDLFDSRHHGDGIVRFARVLEADVVVIGRKGRTNLRYVLLGSFAERVVNQAHSSVLVVPMKKESIGIF